MRNNTKSILLIILILVLALSAFFLVKYYINENADLSNLSILTDPETGKDITFDLSKPEERREYCILRGKQLKINIYQHEDQNKKIEAVKLMRVFYLYDDFSKEEIDLIAQVMVDDEDTSYYEVLEENGVDTEEERIEVLKTMIMGKNHPQNTETSHPITYEFTEDDFNLFVQKLFNDSSLTYRDVLSKYNIVDESFS